MMTNKLYPIELSVFDATTLTNAYQCLNPSGFERPCGYIFINNDSDVSCMISFDGSTDHDVILDYSYHDFKFQANHTIPNLLTLWPRYTKVYVKYILGAAKLGNIYLTGYPLAE